MSRSLSVHQSINSDNYEPPGLFIMIVFRYPVLIVYFNYIF